MNLTEEIINIYRRIETAVTSAIPAGTNIIGKTQPFAGILETEITEIIGADDAECAQNEYSSTADLALGGNYSGELLGFELITDKGDGAVQAGAGVVVFFDADPNTTRGEAASTVVERNTLLVQVSFAARSVGTYD